MARGLTPTVEGWPGAVLADIDWQQPWFAPWRRWGEAAAHDALIRRSVADALNRPAGAWAQAGSGDLASAASMSPNGLRSRPDPIRFVPQSSLPEGEAYEAFIARTRQVPTRDGLHDFFNGLCWARFPNAKRRLNVLQSAEIDRDGIRATRGPVRDALTLFDENAILLQAPDDLWQALQRRDWQTLLVTQREQWARVRVVLFGHALLEKLVLPYKSITGHVWRITAEVDAGDDAALDDWLVQDLQTDKLARKPFEPLPVLGIPGWWPDNTQPDFYADAQVFRPLHSPQPAH